MPQIAQILETYASQIFWLLIVFGLIYFVIGRSMLPKIEATVDARDHKIAGDLAAAKVARSSAEQTEEAWRARMGEARAAAQAEAAAAKSSAARETEAKVKTADAAIAQKLAEAEARIATAQADAVSHIEDMATEAAQAMVAKLSGASVSEAAAKKAVKEALANG